MLTQAHVDLGGLIFDAVTGGNQFGALFVEQGFETMGFAHEIVGHIGNGGFGAFGGVFDLFSVGGHGLAHIVGVGLGGFAGFGEGAFLLSQLLCNSRRHAAGALGGDRQAVDVAGQGLTHAVDFGQGLLARGAHKLMLAAQGVFDLEVHVGGGIDHRLQLGDLVRPRRWRRNRRRLQAGQ